MVSLSQGICTLSVDSLSQLFYQELKTATDAPDSGCRPLAQRLATEVQRICSQSDRIQASGDVEAWAKSLGKHRLDQCLKYYNLGSRQGRVELHSTLSAIVYRYITPPQVQTSYQARLALIEDFLQGFYVEALNAFRRENELNERFQPRTLLELAEYMAFSERYGKRRIPLSGRRSQQLIILRAQTFSRQQPPEMAVDIEQAVDYGGESDDVRPAASHQRVREEMVAQADPLPESSLRGRVVEELLAYLKERNQDECADYFTLRLLDLPTQEIEALLGLTPRQRDYLQQRFKYHLLRFALSHHWELVHEWLEAGLETNLGLTVQEWQQLQATLSPKQNKLLTLKQQGVSDSEAAKILAMTPTQFQKQWSKLLEQAWDIRNV
ncbi:heterocyst differentiation protein HetZ [Nodosilinea sp. LEGE 07088]|uniref:heterocyst differentiation protein HetZ n=1 Tax=Nodosilinea sp. LEGE 07088 TaxID=2777968 RepID=UPI0034D977E0